MNQARAEEEEKERKRDKKERGQEADGKKGSPTKQKHIGGTKTRHTYLGTSNVQFARMITVFSGRLYVCALKGNATTNNEVEG